MATPPTGSKNAENKKKQKIIILKFTNTKKYRYGSERLGKDVSIPIITFQRLQTVSCVKEVSNHIPTATDRFMCERSFYSYNHIPMATDRFMLERNNGYRTVWNAVIDIELNLFPSQMLSCFCAIP